MGQIGFKLERLVSGDGPLNAPIVILTDRPSWNDPDKGRVLSDFSGKLLFSQFRQAGVSRLQIRTEAICERIPPNRNFWSLDSWEQTAWKADALQRLKELSPQVIVPLGDLALELTTGLRTISKRHLSIYPSVESLGNAKVIPFLHPDFILKIYRNVVYWTFGAQRVKEELSNPKLPYTERNFILSPSIDELEKWVKANVNCEWLCVDIETGSNQIICVGFSTNPKEAICIPTLPSDYQSPEDFYRVWKLIAKALESPMKKTGQNIIYDATRLSEYGIRIRNISHDTMTAMKFLHPELSKGLDNVARIYTKEPYWKDEGKDWGTRQDISQLYTYNCKDVAVTLEATFAQIYDLKSRALYDNFQALAVDLLVPCMQMCWTGLPVRQCVKERLTKTTIEQIDRMTQELNAESIKYLNEPINPRSPNQVKKLLISAGFRLPTKQGRETSDYEALLKLQLKSPESIILKALLSLSKENKKLSSYLNYKYDETRGRMNFMLYVNSTETGRWSGGTDGEVGLNVQTIPKALKEQFGYDK